MQIPYRKMHGTGNQILIVDQRAANLSPPNSASVVKLGDAGSGPGFDQMMWLLPANDDVSIARYRVFNADGSEVEQCGNGVRCVAKFLAESEDHARTFSLQSPAGRVETRVLSDGTVAVCMGTPVFDPAGIPFAADAAADIYTIDVGEDVFEISAVSMGNPHCILRVNDVATAPVGELGPQLEHHDRFPQRTNVGFMRIRDRRNIDLRVHERGAGETQACGTGACAAAVTGRQQGLLDRDVRVQLPGGQVMISWRGGASPVWLTGNAERIGEGTVDL